LIQSENHASNIEISKCRCQLVFLDAGLGLMDETL